VESDGDSSATLVEPEPVSKGDEDEPRSLVESSETKVDLGSDLQPATILVQKIEISVVRTSM